MPSYRKGTWAEEEDMTLLSIVSACEPCDWNQISNVLGTRTPKQCAERYHQNLRPGLNHGPLTTYECFLVDKLVREKGTCWAYIAKQLVNRSENKIKNWYYNRRFKRYRDQRQRESHVRASSPYLKFESSQQPSTMLPYQEVPATSVRRTKFLHTSPYITPYVQYHPPQPHTPPSIVVPLPYDIPKSSDPTFDTTAVTTTNTLDPKQEQARASLALHWQMNAFSTGS
ncbi:hypothetical protein AUEXF2481DRAFT_43923 [Aureobasidium subglaciale EXF-2481]|uniref:Myb-like domain-containing protein n=1 Tax=Aureobasidium subglaciale (strain EXF-2481) TaxID=1043005 RepID=A0A074Y6E7_AURSE|nr:uncharacterized protein AUEXF2481DRAFT_43923 [Aureobasidium subglaciale EXF-2481]KAI5200413.1 hypothetical protein E4T38_06519 [Aureobasidium subglaciale]KAI5218934.1 hypothetical protein E4T40_06638 [Aureobasidium subglaciale]KAI5222660.1 hypothetical protein E4T41_06459 [Aureobasidium subglaciale]KAI5260220.1 hypothetical protein E4T46_06171 [Aureobasidium subglaciale]KEQ91529.1 hypothetical protein AUEXF2481DRAFT_43923 [Aureobasidium subglaciale EXF-2481]